MLRSRLLTLGACFALGVSAAALGPSLWKRRPAKADPGAATETLAVVARHMADAEAHLAALRLSAAYHEAKEAEALAPRDAEVQLMLGNIAYQSLWKEAAEGHYRRAADLNPGLTSAHANLALVLLDLGQSREAGDAAQRALSARPGTPFYEALLGRSLLQRGRTRDAVEVLQRAVHNGMPLAETYLGRAHDLLGDGKAALRAFDAALTRDPTDPQTHYWRADCLRRLGRHDEARLARAEHKRQLSLFMNIARLRELLLVHEPDNVTWRLELVGLLIEQKKMREASAALERAEHLQPDNPLVRRLRARLGPPEAHRAALNGS